MTTSRNNRTFSIIQGNPLIITKEAYIIILKVSALNYTMVLILDGNSEHDAHTCGKIGIFRAEKIRFVTALALIKCFKQIK